MAGILSSPVSTRVFRSLPVRIRRPRRAVAGLLGGESRQGVTPYLANAENADVKTLAAIAATHGIAKGEEINQIFELQTRRT
jgi:hypothetical protein